MIKIFKNLLIKNLYMYRYICYLTYTNDLNILNNTYISIIL